MSFSVVIRELPGKPNDVGPRRQWPCPSALCWELARREAKGGSSVYLAVSQVSMNFILSDLCNVANQCPFNVSHHFQIIVGVELKLIILTLTE